MSGFNIKDFVSPQAEMYPGYFWSLQSELTEDLMMKDLRDMCEHGARSLCIMPCPVIWAKNSTMAPDYLTEDYLKVIEKIVNECERLGMHYYFYDEGGYPSGSAVGAVYSSDPERFAPQYIVFDKETGKYRAKKFHPAKAPGYPNLLEKGATEKFLELNHDPHKNILQRHFGKTIKFTFTDEPVLPGYMQYLDIGWCSDFGDEFFRRMGYHLEPYFDDLRKQPRINEPESVRRHRIDYCDVRAQLFAERYVGGLRDWARKYGLLSGGHFGGEDLASGNYYHCFGSIMRSLRAMDFPGVDVIWRQLYPVSSPRKPNRKLHSFTKHDPISTGAKSRPFNKYASSIAHQAGRTAVLSESFAVYGGGLKPEVMRWLLDYQMLRGATRFVFSNIPLRDEGTLINGCRPHFGKHDILWDWFDIMHNYIARVCAIISQGEPQINTLVHFNIRAVWAGGKMTERIMKQHEKTAEALLQRQCDFDFTDDDALESAKIRNGLIQIGKMNYDTLVIDSTDYMTDKALAMVKKFKSAGGKVITGAEADQITPTLQLKKPNRWIRAAKRTCGQETLYYVMNEGPTPANVTMLIPETGSLQLYDAERGKRCELPRKGNELKWKFPPYGAILLVVNSSHKADETYRPFRPSKTVITPENWTLQPVKQTFIKDREFKVIYPDTAPVPAKFGDWCEILGETFTGEVVYRTTFDFPCPGKDALLDCEKVKYACRVTLNGKDLGKKFWGPYEFILPADLLKEKDNVLEIKVVNTMANVFRAKDALDCETVASGYDEYQRAFEEESLESGLTSPVRIIAGTKK